MINAAAIILNGVFDILLLPFRPFPHLWGLLFISLLSGLGMIMVFRLVSNQDKISRLRRRMGGCILGILLHLSNPLTVMEFAGKLIWSNTVYLLYLIKPLIVIAIPLMLVWGQLDARYGAAAMDKEDPVTVTIFYEDGLPVRGSLEIGVSGLELIPPVVLIDTLDEASFRVLPVGDFHRTLEIEGVSIQVGRTESWNGCRILRGFDSGSSLKRLFCPWIGKADKTEGSPASGCYSLPDVRYGVLGGHWYWIAVFLVFSTLSAIIGAKVFNVKI
ncbi:MAG: hypothetical protein GQ565_12425 [Candidatus Aegiribacteria sp.]|nr:hypothetical protein [Candidatus Aegiribacteria sp.]